MGCIYEYYKEDEYFPRLYCKLGNYCIYSKRCLKVNKFIPIDNQKECYVMIEEMKKSIPKNSYYVQAVKPNKSGFLYVYVVIGDKVEKILTTFKELNQNHLYLKETENGYEVSLTPFRVRTYNKKKQSNTYDEKE